MSSPTWTSNQGLQGLRVSSTSKAAELWVKLHGWVAAAPDM